MITIKDALSYLVDEYFENDSIIYQGVDGEVSDIIGMVDSHNSQKRADSISLTFWGGLPFRKIDANLYKLYEDRKLYRRAPDLYDKSYGGLITNNTGDNKAILMANLAFEYIEPLDGVYIIKNRYGESAEYVTMDEFISNHFQENCVDCVRMEKELDLREVKIGDLLRNKGSGQCYTVVYHNGEYPTLSKTITAMNPSEWEIVKD